MRGGGVSQAVDWWLEHKLLLIWSKIQKVCEGIFFRALGPREVMENSKNGIEIVSGRSRSVGTNSN